MDKVYTIYMVTNTIDNKKYIGFDCAWPRRKRSHLNSARSHSQTQYKQLFHNAIRKYGEENFTWDVIYQSKDGEHTLNVMEQHFITEYRTYVGFDDCAGYNLTLGGEGQLGRVMSEETRQKKSKALKGKPSPQSRPVHTPHGTFDSLSIASTSLNIHPRTLTYRIKSAGFSDWCYVDQPKISLSTNMRTGMSCEIYTPYGIFTSTDECSRSTGIPKSTIQDRLKSPLQPDWGLTGKTTKAGTRPVHTPHGTFNSLSEAAVNLSMSTSTIAARIRSNRMKDWHYY